MDIDISLKLLKGSDIEVDGYGNLRPLKIGEIIDYGYSKYMSHLKVFCYTRKDFEDIINPTSDEFNIFETIIILTANDPSFKAHVCKSFSFILGGNVNFDIANLCFFVDNGNEIKNINIKNFESIITAVKMQNYISYDNHDENTEEDEEVKKFRDRMSQYKKKINEIKQQEESDDENIDIFDIISSVSTKAFSINELNIFDLTVYQLYTKFKRLHVLEKYDVGIKSALVGAKGDIPHWTKKIE